jgi:hypothetical protein
LYNILMDGASPCSIISPINRLCLLFWMAQILGIY